MTSIIDLNESFKKHDISFEQLGRMLEKDILSHCSVTFAVMESSIAFGISKSIEDRDYNRRDVFVTSTSILGDVSSLHAKRNEINLKLAQSGFFARISSDVKNKCGRDDIADNATRAESVFMKQSTTLEKELIDVSAQLTQKIKVAHDYISRYYPDDYLSLVRERELKQ